MKAIPPLLIVGLLVALSARGTEPDDQLPPAPHGKSSKLIWHDEFDGDKLDESKWEPRPDGKRKGAGGAPQRFRWMAMAISSEQLHRLNRALRS